MVLYESTSRNYSRSRTLCDVNDLVRKRCFKKFQVPALFFEMLDSIVFESVLG